MRWGTIKFLLQCQVECRCSAVSFLRLPFKELPDPVVGQWLREWVLGLDWGCSEPRGYWLPMPWCWTMLLNLFAHLWNRDRNACFTERLGESSSRVHSACSTASPRNNGSCSYYYRYCEGRWELQRNNKHELECDSLPLKRLSSIHFGKTSSISFEDSLRKIINNFCVDYKWKRYFGYIELNKICC